MKRESVGSATRSGPRKTKKKTVLPNSTTSGHKSAGSGVRTGESAERGREDKNPFLKGSVRRFMFEKLQKGITITEFVKLAKQQQVNAQRLWRFFQNWAERSGWEMKAVSKSGSQEVIRLREL